jgi:hypothetical protein
MSIAQRLLDAYNKQRKIPVTYIDTPPVAIEVTPLWTVYNEPPLSHDLSEYLRIAKYSK